MTAKHYCNLVTLFLCLLSGLPSALSQYQLIIKLTTTLYEPVPFFTVNMGDESYISDSSGHYISQLQQGRHTFIISSTGYQPLSHTIDLYADTTIHLFANEAEHQLQEVIISSRKKSTLTDLGNHHLNIEEIKKLPVILGEVDPLKTITLLPGIKNGGEGGNGIYVRGGGPDQNLILLDNIPIYNPNHLIGFFSIFNGDAIQSVNVQKGAMPANYGGRLSSIIEIDTRPANKDSLLIKGGIGFLSSRLSIETPLSKKTTIMASGRRTYADQLARILAKDKIGSNTYYFYDLNARLDHEINQQHSLQLTVYSGKDKFNYSSNKNHFNALWGNNIAGLTWKFKNKKWRNDASVVYNQFGLDSYYDYAFSNYIFTSAIKDYQFKNDFQYNVSNLIHIKAGVQYIKHQFAPGAGDLTQDVSAFKASLNKLYAHEAAAYTNAEIKVNRNFVVNAGLRYSYFNQVGPTESYLYDEDGLPLNDVRKYESGETIARYVTPEPRLSLGYNLTTQQTLRLSYTKTAQYIHLASTSGATLPSDIWLPSGQIVQPGYAQQASLGWFLQQQVFQFSIETYYKHLDNQIEFKPGAQFFMNQNMESEMVFGTGKAYGIELLAEKKRGKLTGWIGYTLSKAERTFDQLNGGNPFPYRYDRKHDASMVASYQLNAKWNISAVFVYATGNALTVPTGTMQMNMSYSPRQKEMSFTNIQQYETVNNFRMPANHRLDVSATYTPYQPNKKLNHSWSFNVYNVYNRKNPYFIYSDIDQEEQRTSGKMVYLFPVTPSVTWNFNINP